MIRVVCAIVQREDGKVLLAQRPAGKHLALKWEFPGGKVEPGEVADVALIREIDEELGCTVEIQASLPSCVHDYEKSKIELIPFICRVVVGEPRAIEHAAIAWVAPDALADYDLAPADVPALGYFMAYLSEKMPRLFQK
ncbi:MAG: (deoxy)nucleoside triphosphate pyrophosphohydrolase [Verrucomicrobiaceae bacterium]|nr:(deoxy)nucleoside triphosphate pyrophosphohydrolase [Verrucomicrobiaceae bacterium]